MLFSSREVSEYIQARFEPAWETVRPAPQVTIDFGNGRVIRRTLQGNVATYVCAADGTVMDVLPGIYTREAYRSALEGCAAFSDSLRSASGDDRVAKLREYHGRKSYTLLQVQPTPQMQAIARTGGGLKGGGLEHPLGGLNAGPGFGGIVGISGNGFGGMMGHRNNGFGGIEGPTIAAIIGQSEGLGAARPSASGSLATRPELALDAKVNELIRRRQVHERLSNIGPVRPDELKKWLFKEVLHADLDDPLLGLGAVLDANYPFADEDRAAGR